MGLWFWTGSDQYYTRTSLYDYSDGGAELFLSYGFDKVISRTYIAEDQPEIKVDLFDLGAPENAFGVFCHIRESLQDEYGQGSVVYEDAILFWKHRYYISLTSDDITLASEQTLKDIAAYIDASISTEGGLPAILDHLPEKGLIHESILYFKHYIWQNSRYYFADENILGIEGDCEAVLARYDLGPHQPVCLIIKYPDGYRAARAAENFELAFEMDGGPEPSTIRIEDETWIGVKRIEPLLVIVFNAPDRDALTEILNRINH
jgi:hypothetical protein